MNVAAMSSAEAKKKVVLISIDGWGLTDAQEGNAIYHAETPNMDRYAKDTKRYAAITAHGNCVGLPKGIMGNSEVGHLTMGAGRVQYQDLARINKSIEDGVFEKNPVLLDVIEKAKSGSGRLHFLGLVSDGAVHSHIQHLFRFLEVAKEHQVPDTFVHFFADGRDTPPSSGHTYIQQLLDFQKDLDYSTLATITGRYYAMDRDTRWERVKIAYEGIMKGEGEHTNKDSVIDVVHKRYAAGETDEFLKPIIVDKSGCIQDGDCLVFIDFRADRMREIVQCVGFKPAFETDTIRKNLNVVQMTQYKKEFSETLPMLYSPQSMDNVLAEWLSKRGIRQFHTAETEKYAHVTFFFNGGREQPFELEERAMIKSPAVATYDLCPGMSMTAVADSVIDAVKSGNFPFVMCNLAPPDMVGHTGVYDATLVACADTDREIGRIEDACKQHGFVLVITSDHGNAEEMLDASGKPKTSHTCNKVPLVVTCDDSITLCRADGEMSDVAPTVLDIMGISIPEDMTGSSALAH